MINQSRMSLLFSQAEGAQLSTGSPIRLLLVDDDPGHLDLCSRRLFRASADYTIDCAVSANEAVHLCKKNEYDCLLVDFQLPDGSGADVVDRIRAQNTSIHNVQRAAPPAIIVTAESGAHAATQAIRAGAVDFISKSDLTTQALQRSISHAIERWQLEASIAIRNIALEQANAELERANEQLELRRGEILKFYHSVSHEVKTPLAAAREFISLVRDGVVGAVSQEQNELLGYAMDSCDNIRDQFSELLDLARVDCGKLRLERQTVNVDSLVKRCAASVADSARKKDINIDMEDISSMYTVYCDREKIIQVLSNLMVNAVKFTAPGGSVRIGLSTDNTHSVTFEVMDTGCGISAKDLEFVFERMYQVEDSDNTLSHSGLGLGLSISQEILKLHDTKLSVTSELGVGSTFKFILPTTVNQT